MDAAHIKNHFNLLSQMVKLIYVYPIYAFPVRAGGARERTKRENVTQKLFVDKR